MEKLFFNRATEVNNDVKHMVLESPNCNMSKLDQVAFATNMMVEVKLSDEELDCVDNGGILYMAIHGKIVGMFTSEAVGFYPRLLHFADIDVATTYPGPKEQYYLTTLSNTEIKAYYDLPREEQVKRFDVMEARLNVERTHVVFNLGKVFDPLGEAGAEYENVSVAINGLPVEVAHKDLTDVITMATDESGKIHLMTGLTPKAIMEDQRYTDLELNIPFTATMQEGPLLNKLKERTSHTYDTFTMMRFQLPEEVKDYTPTPPYTPKEDVSLEALREVLFDSGFVVPADVDFTSHSSLVEYFSGFNLGFGKFVEMQIDEFFMGYTNGQEFLSHHIENVNVRFDKSIKDYESFRAFVKTLSVGPLDSQILNHTALIETMFQCKIEFSPETKQDINDIYLAIAKYTKENGIRNIKPGATIVYGNGNWKMEY